MLFDLGNVAFLMGDYKTAALDYGRAKEYGLEGILVEKRMEKANKLALKGPIQRKVITTVQPRNAMIWIGGGILLLIIVAAIVIIKRQKNKRDRVYS